MEPCQNHISIYLLYQLFMKNIIKPDYDDDISYFMQNDTSGLDQSDVLLDLNLYNFIFLLLNAYAWSKHTTFNKYISEAIKHYI